MADPFSIAAGVVSVTAPALQAISLFFSALDRIQKAPPTIRTLSDNVRKTEGTIRMVERIEEETWALLGAEVAEYSKMMVGQCGQACELVRRNIEHCTRHSADGRMSWRDRTKIGLLKPNLIKALSAQVEYCQLAVNSTVSIATLYTTVRQTQITQAVIEMMRDKQTEVTRVAACIGRDLTMVQRDMGDLQGSSEDDDEDEDDSQGGGRLSGSDRATELQQLERQCEALDISRKLLDELWNRIQEECLVKIAAGAKTTSGPVTFGSHNSGLQTYTINGGVSHLTFGVRQSGT